MKKSRKIFWPLALIMVNLFQTVASAESLGRNEITDYEEIPYLVEEAVFLGADEFKEADPADTYESGLPYEKEVLDAYKLFTENNESKGYLIEVCLEDFDELYREGNVLQAYQLNEEIYLDYSSRISNLQQCEYESETPDGERGSNYYYNIGTNPGTKPNYNNYNLLQMAQKGDIIFDTEGSHGIAGHAAIVEGKFWSSTQNCYYIRVIEAIDAGVKRGLIDDVRANERGSKLYRVFVASTSEKAAAVNFCVNQLDESWYLNLSHDYDGNQVLWLCSQLVWAGYKNQGIDIECNSGGGVGVLPKDITEKSEKVTYVEYKFCPYSISDGTYYIKNVKSGLRLDVRGSITDSSQIQQYTAGNYSDQKWVIIYNSNGRYYTIRSAASTLSNPYYLDVASPSSGAHAKVKLWHTNTNIEEKWYIQLLANSQYRFINAYSGLCMDIQGGSTSSGADVQVYPYEGTADQKWQILTV